MTSLSLGASFLVCTYVNKIHSNIRHILPVSVSRIVPHHVAQRDETEGAERASFFILAVYCCVILVGLEMHSKPQIESSLVSCEVLVMVAW